MATEETPNKPKTAAKKVAKSVKKTPSKSTPSKKTPAKKVASKAKSPAKKTAATKAPAKKAPAKKVPAKKVPAAKKTAQVQTLPAATPEKTQTDLALPVEPRPVVAKQKSNNIFKKISKIFKR